jgi:protein-disulfide isomerase
LVGRLFSLAAECASQEGRWEQFHDVIYADQDSLGLKSWSMYALAAGIRDTARFSRCLRETKTALKVDSALKVGDALKLHATPTVLVDGWRTGASLMTP